MQSSQPRFNRRSRMEQEHGCDRRRGLFLVTGENAQARARLGVRDRLARLRGRGKKWALRRLESLAYDVIGFPLAVRRYGRSPVSSPAERPAAYLHEFYGQTYWRWPGGLIKALTVPILWPAGLVYTVVLYTRR